MSRYVVKRNGEQQLFDIEKIKQAISKANASVSASGKLSTSVVDSLAGIVQDRCERLDQAASVEDIQDLIETELMRLGYFELAKAYITYRYERQLARDNYTQLMNAVDEKIQAKNIKNQNANVDEASAGGRQGEASDVLQRHYALNFLMSKKSKDNHENNEIYIHDLNAYSVGIHNCLTLPLDMLLEKGFNTRQVDIRPAQSVSTAMQLVAVLFQIQSLQQFGGVAASHLDHTMVPYVRKSFYKHFKEVLDITEEECNLDDIADYLSITSPTYTACPKTYKFAMKRLDKEIYQAVEALYHNLNSLQSRSGSQLPFSSVNYGTCTLPEGRKIIKALLGISIKGLGKLHKTSIFPCGIFQMMKGVNRKPGDPNYDLFRLALRSTSQRLYPNYANCDWSNNAGYDKNDPRTYFATMGCRTANLMDINGLGQLKDGRGNICPVTIILPTLAMEAGRDFNKFMELLDTKIGEAKDMLLERFEYICSQPPETAGFMYENNTMAGYVPAEGIRSALKHGTLAIGQLGLAETLNLLIGKDHTTPEGMEKAKEIEALFKKRCAEFKQALKLNFAVYYTPAENLCHTALVKFRNKYGVIPNVSDREYFTNSMHVPVWTKISATEKIDIESQLTGYSSAGCITYVELDAGCKSNLDALETLVNYAMDKDVPYFAINVPNDQCMNCGYIDELGETCPQCGSRDIKRLRRVTGYLSSSYLQFNQGKIAEVEDRVKHELYEVQE